MCASETSSLKVPQLRVCKAVQKILFCSVHKARTFHDVLDLNVRIKGGKKRRRFPYFLTPAGTIFK